MACRRGAFPDRLDVDCGYVRVPEDRSHPRGRQIRVAAAVVHATAADPAPEPILLLPGGPSAGAISRFSIRAYFSGSTWAADHDIVLVDTRGVGQSRPRLGCPEIDRADVRNFYARPGVGSRAPRIFGHALEHCRRRLVASGIDPADYTVHEGVADLEALRRAIGVDRWNLMAVSADGILGMSYLREHPGSIRAAIVDSGMAPQMLTGIDYDRGLSQQLEAVFAGCAANRACRDAYPHLRRVFMRAVHRLNRHPRVVHFPMFRPHPVHLRLDGAGVYFDAVHQIFPGNVFVGDDIHHLIDSMWRIGHGQLTAVYREMFGTGPQVNYHQNSFVAVGRTMSLECHDVTNFVTRRDLRRAARDLPMYAPRYRSRSYDLGDTLGNYRSPAGCRIWDVGRARPRQHRPVVSSVPALVLAGEYDGGVTPYTVHKNVRGLSHATYVEFRAASHQQLAFFNIAHRCARSIAAEFLAHPHAAPDTSCADTLPPFDFTPPAGRPVGRLGVPRLPGMSDGRFRLVG
ncbi:alpha/beta fold hydrolase [Nocardioides sp.]|uniref:alpha/beta fold hydrolase n=1 Tax=Nocardioides sp. TaxID=35761 RepID=UPI0031FF4488